MFNSIIHRAFSAHEKKGGGPQVGQRAAALLSPGLPYDGHAQQVGFRRSARARVEDMTVAFALRNKKFYGIGTRRAIAILWLENRPRPVAGLGGPGIFISY